MHNKIAAVKTVSGFTIVELLLSTVLGAIVLAALGAALLVSEIRVTRNSVSAQNLRDNARQASLLIINELNNSSQLRSGSNGETLPSSCNSGIGSIPLVVIGKGGNWKSYYYSVPSSTFAAGQWYGPAVLMRCGPPYQDSGIIDESKSSLESVMLDKLIATNGFTVDLTQATGTLNRQLRFSVAMEQAGSPITTSSFIVRTAANPMYGLYDLIVESSNYCTPSTTEPCKVMGNTEHFLPPKGKTASPIEGNISKEEVIYFPGRLSDYSLTKDGTSGTVCTRATCNVKGGPTSTSDYDTDLKYFNVIVFSDAERRL